MLHREHHLRLTFSFLRSGTPDTKSPVSHHWPLFFSESGTWAGSSIVQVATEDVGRQHFLWLTLVDESYSIQSHTRSWNTSITYVPWFTLGQQYRRFCRSDSSTRFILDDSHVPIETYSRACTVEVGVTVACVCRAATVKPS